MRTVAAILVLVVGASLLTACGDDDTEVLPVVQIFGPYRGDEATLFMAGLDDWAASQGIDIRYTGSTDFAGDLQFRVREILDPPDIAIVPQPGLVSELAGDGLIVPLSEALAEGLMSSFDGDILDLARVDGDLVGFPYRSNVKSLVWYRPEVFAELGVEPPTSMQELEALVEQLVSSGLTPWCLGIEAQSATGWPATDWVEDLIVRAEGSETYERWVDGSVPFENPAIADAFTTLADLVLQPTRVAGGVGGVLTTSTQDSDDPLFADPPGCVLFKQASFAYGWMPAGLELGPDGDIAFFVLPSIESGATPPLVVGADLAVAFDDRPEVEAVMARLATAEAGQAWAQGGSYLSLRSDVDPATYYRDVDRAVAQILADTDVVVFDGSDSMEPAVGTDLFWTEITAWIAGQRSYEDLAATLDTARAE